MQILYVRLPKYIYLYNANSLVPPHGGGIDMYSHSLFTVIRHNGTNDQHEPLLH